MNEITEEIKTKVKKYGIDVVFLGQSQGWCGASYDTLAVTVEDSPKSVLDRINNMIDKRGELMLLRLALKTK